MSRRVPWAYARVVKACRSLTATDKMIWLEHVALATGDGGVTYISARGLGARVAVARVTVERARHEFLRLGLITKRDRGPGRTDEWCPCLPRDCQPTGQRLTDDDLERYAELLDRHIANLTHPVRELQPAGVEVGPPARRGLNE